METVAVETKKSTGTKKPKSSKPKKTEESTPVVEQQSLAQETEPVSVAPEPVVQSSSEPQVEVTTETVQLQGVDINAMTEFLNQTSDKLSEFTKQFKDVHPSKDERSKFDSAFKKCMKAVTAYQTSYMESLSKQVSTLEKSSGSKPATVKKVTDKDKSAIHKPLQVHQFLLDFMKLDKGTLVSRSQALTAITGYVKAEKLKNPDIKVEGDNRAFKITGDLKKLFDGIDKVIAEKKVSKPAMSPTQIRYTDIMSYMTHCFVPVEKEAKA
jgi:hypothetical protein